MLGERRSNSLFAPAAPAEPERKPEQAEVHDISFEERTGRSLFAEASTAPRASELFFAPQEKGVTFAEALSQVQSYLSETYATLITEDNSDAKEQMKRRMARYLQENRIAVDGMTASELVDALYTEMAEYGFLTKYIHFTEEQKQRAAAVNLEEFLRCRGEKLLSSGREKRLASDHSVTVRGNEWYDHAEERGGHAVSFVQRFYGLSYPDAVTMLLGGELGTAYPSAGERTEEPVKPFALPPANKDMRRVFAYLIKHRSIARDVVARFAKAGLLYEDAEYHNAVFVGTDTDGVPRHAHKRSANSYGKAFRLNVEGSDPRYSFHHVGTDRSLYVFEAPIDMLSFITLYPENWQRHSYVACCGTSIQPVLQMLEQVPQLDTVLLCLDNDEAGHQASRRMQNQLEVRYSVERLIPENKDWNDDLTLNSENAQGLAMNEMR